MKLISDKIITKEKGGQRKKKKKQKRKASKKKKELVVILHSRSCRKRLKSSNAVEIRPERNVPTSSTEKDAWAIIMFWLCVLR